MSSQHNTGAATLGLRKYLEAGVPAKQLILGVPWYGYGYTCLEGQGPGTASLANAASPYCVIEQVPFRGVPCSDAAGGELAYVGVMEMLNTNATTTGGSQWVNSTVFVLGRGLVQYSRSAIVMRHVAGVEARPSA